MYQSSNTKLTGVYKPAIDKKVKDQRDLSNYHPDAQASISKGLKDGTVRFEDNSNGGEYIFSADKSFGKDTTKKGIFSKIGDIANKVKDKVIDVTSDVLAAPAVMSANRKAGESNRVADAIIKTKKSVGVADTGDYRDPLFQARATAAAAGYKGKKKATGSSMAMKK